MNFSPARGNAMAEQNPPILLNSKQLLAALGTGAKGKQSRELRALLYHLDVHEKVRGNSRDTASCEKSLANVRAAYYTWANAPPGRRSFWQRVLKPHGKTGDTRGAVIRQLGEQLTQAGLMLSAESTAGRANNEPNRDKPLPPLPEPGRPRELARKSTPVPGTPQPSRRVKHDPDGPRVQPPALQLDGRKASTLTKRTTGRTTLR